jgi:hypothetical protein
MMFSGCKKDKDGGDDDGGNGGATVALTLSLEKGVNDNEIIVKCTPKCPWLAMGFPPCYFNHSDLLTPFYIAVKTGGNATQIFTTAAYDLGWNEAGTEYTYVFGYLGGENWEGTVTLAPVDQDIKIESMGVKSITIGKNTPVSLKLGY